MCVSFPLPTELPPAADAAVAIVRRLAERGHVALLAGGCVRDLLLGRHPNDFDVATDARPDQVRRLFRATRLVGAQFGVVLVRKHRRWVEVAAFRADGPYLDGRHPAEVVYSNAREDARRRDFTVNGMFLDPLAGTVSDYVNGQTDLRAGLIRAIGEPAARFEEDHLRLLRAVRFAARLEFTIEPVTLAAIRANADKLAGVAAERIREELAKMLTHPNRRSAFAQLADTGLLPYLWPRAGWQPQQVEVADTLLANLARDVRFDAAFAALVADRPAEEFQTIARALSFSNEDRDNVAWLVEHQADLDNSPGIALSALKRLMAHPAFDSLRQLAEARWATIGDDPQRVAALNTRLATIPPESVAPPPLVTGDDLIARGIEPGPVFKPVLETLYTRQLDETLVSRRAALTALDELLREQGALP